MRGALDAERLDEVDAAFRSLNVVASLGAGAVGLALTPTFGADFLGAALLPTAYWVVRLSPLGRHGPTRTWLVVMLITLGAAVVGGALSSGGSASPVLMLAGILGVMTHVYFPDLRVSVATAVAPLVLFGVWDTVLGAELRPELLGIEAFLAAYLTLFAARVIGLVEAHHHRASTDKLTGCLNRHALESRSHELEEQGERQGGHLGVVVFDLDHFKRLNDEHGHADGDKVLSGVADVVRGSLRRFELLYRLGGEEFAVLLPGADIATTLRIAERVRGAIAAQPISGHAVTASVGASSAAAPFVVDEVLDDADRRLYEAKAAGRDRVVAAPYDPRRLVRSRH